MLAGGLGLAGAALASTAEMLRHDLAQRGVTLRTDFGELPPVPGHPGKLNQVFLNVLQNATQACTEGGAIDVRTRAEFNTVRVPGAINVPLDRLDPQALRKRFGDAATLYFICQTGTRSQLAAKMLRSAGFPHVVHVDGGTNAWSAAGLPVERGT